MDATRNMFCILLFESDNNHIVGLTWGQLRPDGQTEGMCTRGETHSMVETRDRHTA